MCAKSQRIQCDCLNTIFIFDLLYMPSLPTHTQILQQLCNSGRRHSDRGLKDQDLELLDLTITQPITCLPLQHDDIIVLKYILASSFASNIIEGVIKKKDHGDILICWLLLSIIVIVVLVVGGGALGALVLVVALVCCIILVSWLVTVIEVDCNYILSTGWILDMFQARSHLLLL